MKKKIGAILGVALVAVMLVALLVGCVPSDPAKAESNLKDAGYVVVKLEATEEIEGMLRDLDADTIKAVVTGTKATLADGVDHITIIYFKDTSAAKDYYNKIKESWDKMTDEQKEKAGEIGRSGSAVYSGSSDAVKAAK